MISLKKYKKPELTNLLKEFGVEYSNEATKEAIIVLLESYIDKNKIEDSFILSIMDKELQTEDSLSSILVIEEDSLKAENETILDNSKKLEIKYKPIPSILSREEKDWIKYLEDRNMTVDAFLKFRPQFPQKDIMKKLKELGY